MMILKYSLNKIIITITTNKTFITDETVTGEEKKQ